MGPVRSVDVPVLVPTRANKDLENASVREREQQIGYRREFGSSDGCPLELAEDDSRGVDRLLNPKQLPMVLVRNDDFVAIEQPPTAFGNDVDAPRKNEGTIVFASRDCSELAAG